MTVLIPQAPSRFESVYLCNTETGWNSLDRVPVYRRDLTSAVLNAPVVTLPSVNRRSQQDRSERARRHISAVGILTDEPLPPLRKWTMSVRNKPQVSMKAFVEAQKQGIIVVRPLRAVDFSVSDRYIPVPGITALTNAATVTLGIPMPTVYARCYAPSPWRRSPYYEQPAGVPTNPGPEWANNDNIHTASFPSIITTAENVQRLSDVLDLKPLFSKVLSDLDGMTPDVGLVTGTVAELHAGQWDILTEIAEAPSTIKMILDLLLEIIRGYKETVTKVAAVKKKHRPNGREAVEKMIDEVAGLWMQYRYGIQPIVYSVNDALNYLDMKTSRYVTVRNGANHSYTCTVGSVTLKANVRERCWAKAHLDTALKLTHLQLNALKTGYELIPLSFVLDWALNVGDILSALMPPKGAKQTVVTSSYQLTDVEIDHAVHGPLKSDMRYYRMSVIEPMAVIGLNFDLRLTWKRVLDAASLGWFAARNLDRKVLQRR